MENIYIDYYLAPRSRENVHVNMDQMFELNIDFVEFHWKNKILSRLYQKYAKQGIFFTSKFWIFYETNGKAVQNR